MSDAIKPTPGPWVLWGDANPSQVIANPRGMIAQTLGGNDEDNARLIAEAGTVFHETGLTPSQLAERNAELVEALLRLARNFPTDSDMAEAGWESLEIEDACNAYDAARAALAKCQPKPQEVK